MGTRRRAPGDFPLLRALVIAPLLSASCLIGLLAQTGHAQLSGPNEVAATRSSGPTPLFGLRPGLYGKTTLEQGHYQYAVSPHAQVDDSVVILNLSDRTQEFDVYAADMEQSAGGALAPKDRTDKKVAVGKWIAVDRSHVTIGPHGQTTVAFHLDVPAFAAPGDHLGAVVASTKNTPSPGSIAVESRVALTVRVRIPGVAKLDGAVGPMTVTNGDGGKKFTIEVRNTGNLLFTVKGSVDVHQGTSIVATASLSPADVYVIPGGVARFTGVWSGTPMFGKRQAQASFTLTADEMRPLTRTSNVLSMTFVPWIFLILIFVVLIGFLARFVARRRTPVTGRQNNGRADDWAPPQEVASEATSGDSADWFDR